MPQMGAFVRNIRIAGLIVLAVLCSPAVALGAGDCVDYPDFFACLHGPDIPVAAECAAADLCGDDDVDLVDLAMYQPDYAGPCPNDQRIVGYYISWAVYVRNYHPLDIPAEKITHVNYAFANIGPDLRIAIGDYFADVDKYYPGDTWQQPYRGAYNQLNNVLRAQHPHLKTLISVGGWTWSGLFSDAALTVASRASFAESCVTHIRTYNFDGVDIDWEYPVCCGLESNHYRPEDKENFTLLLAELRAQLDAAAAEDGREYLLTIAAPAGYDKMENIEMDAIAQYLDWINVMCYDLRGAWDLECTAHHPGLFANPNDPADPLIAERYNGNWALQAWHAAGVPSGKLVMGVPFYGRAWGGVPATDGGLFQAGNDVPPGTWDDWVIWDWELEFDFAHTIGSIWDARIVDYSAGRYTIAAVDAAWEDGDLSPGETATFSFIASPGGDVETPSNGELNDTPIVFNGDSPAPPPLAPLEPPTWPSRFFAPYVDTVLWPPFDLVGMAQSEGQRFFTLAFIVAHGAGECTPSWGGYYTVDSGYMLLEINALRELGGDVIVSFGGASGIELAAACEDVEQLTSAYQSAIDAYNLTHIDFDIEGALVAEPVSIARRSAAIAALQAQADSAGRELDVWYTLPVLPTGLTQDGVNVLQSALDYGVDIGGVNVMAMDYGDTVAPEGNTMMGEYAIEAATNLFGQLQTLYNNAGIPKTDEELWKMVGVTPMIGLNDVVTETFWQEDAHQLLTFAEAQDIGMLAFWSANRDNECPGGETGYVSPTCNLQQYLAGAIRIHQHFPPVHMLLCGRSERGRPD